MINKTNKTELLRTAVKSVQSRVIAVIMMLVIFATSVFAAFTVSYSVEIVDDGQVTQVSTTRSEPMDILSQFDVQVSDADRIDLSAFDSGKGGKIVINRAKDIRIDYAGELVNYQLYSTTVADALKEAGIELNDKCQINYALDEKAFDGMVISIVVPNPVTIEVDSAVKVVVAFKGTVADLLKDNGITLGTQDTVSPALDTPVHENMKVVVNRVTYSEVTETESIAYKTTTKNDSSLAAGSTKVLTQGKNGSKDVTYKVKLVDGVVTEKTVISEKITAQPVNKVVAKGTKKSGGTTSTTSNNQTITSNPARKYNGIAEGDIISGKASHYCACKTCNGSSSTGTTASGMKIYNGMQNPYIVACNWLPLGTKIKVNGVLYTVADRGGRSLSTKGRLDIFTPGGHALCKKLGTPKIKIEIVRLSATN